MKQQLCQRLVAIAAAGAASLAVAQAPALAHQVQTNYILNDSTNRFANPQLPEQLLDRPSSQAPAETGTSIELQTGFFNGEPLKGASVAIYAPNQPGRIWAKGVTDSEGKFNFEPDMAIQGDWEVRITRAGHADILTVPVSDRGIEADLMAQGEKTDLHYAQTSPWAIAGSIAIAVACVGVAKLDGRRRAA